MNNKFRLRGFTRTKILYANKLTKEQLLKFLTDSESTKNKIVTWGDIAHLFESKELKNLDKPMLIQIIMHYGLITTNSDLHHITKNHFPKWESYE